VQSAVNRSKSQVKNSFTDNYHIAVGTVVNRAVTFANFLLLAISVQCFSGVVIRGIHFGFKGNSDGTPNQQQDIR